MWRNPCTWFFFMPVSWHKSPFCLLYNNDMGLEIYHLAERK
nr:MAG TPA: hypothetical protein [Caudoviricetes sp.]